VDLLNNVVIRLGPNDTGGLISCCGHNGLPLNLAPAAMGPGPRWCAAPYLY
jgi:hypothetical protein